MNRLSSIPSQILQVTYNNLPLQITLDSGATVSYIKLDKAQSLGLSIAPNNQLALLADQQTRMASLGEVDFVVSMGNVLMRIRALVMKNLQAECFGGTTFHADNDIEARIKTGTISIHGRFIVHQLNPYEVMRIQPPPTEEIQSAQLGAVHNVSLDHHSPKPPEFNSSNEQPVKMNAISLSLSMQLFSGMMIFRYRCLSQLPSVITSASPPASQLLMETDSGHPKFVK